MKKSTAIVMAIILCLSLVAGCSSPSTNNSVPATNGSSAPASSAPGAATNPTDVSIAVVSPIGTPLATAGPVMEEKLNTSGLFKAAFYPEAQLGSVVDLLDRCLADDPIVLFCDPVEFADITVPEIGALSAPFLITSFEQYDKLYASNWWKDIEAKVAEKGLTIIAKNAVMGDRHILTKKPVVSLADLKGMKIRVPPTVAYIAGFTALGANPTPMAVTEIYTSLQQGVIDGLEHPYPDIVSRKNYEVAKNVVVQPHIKQIFVAVCGKGFFDSLTPEQQQLIISANMESFEYNNTLVAELNDAAEAEMRASGVTFNDINIEEFAAAAKGFFEYPDMAEWSPGLYDELMSIING